MRYGYQAHVGDRWNVSPRVSLAWSPNKNGTLTIRGSYGYFCDWVAGDIYKQTLLVDGYRQRELNIRNPTYPDPGMSGIAPPTNRYLRCPFRILSGTIVQPASLRPSCPFPGAPGWP